MVKIMNPILTSVQLASLVRWGLGVVSPGACAPTTAYYPPATFQENQGPFGIVIGPG